MTHDRFALPTWELKKVAAVAMSLLDTLMQEILCCGTSDARYLMICGELEAVEGCKDEWLPEKSLHPLLVKHSTGSVHKQSIRIGFPIRAMPTCSPLSESLYCMSGSHHSWARIIRGTSMRCFGGHLKMCFSPICVCSHRSRILRYPVILPNETYQLLTSFVKCMEFRAGRKSRKVH